MSKKCSCHTSTYCYILYFTIYFGKIWYIYRISSLLYLYIFIGNRIVIHWKGLRDDYSSLKGIICSIVLNLPLIKAVTLRCRYSYWMLAGSFSTIALIMIAYIWIYDGVCIAYLQRKMLSNFLFILQFSLFPAVVLSNERTKPLYVHLSYLSAYLSIFLSFYLSGSQTHFFF